MPDSRHLTSGFNEVYYYSLYYMFGENIAVDPSKKEIKQSCPEKFCMILDINSLFQGDTNIHI